MRYVKSVNGISTWCQPCQSSVNDVVHSSDASPLAPPSLISKLILLPEPGGSGAVFWPYHQKRMPLWADQSWAGWSAAKSWLRPP